MLPTSQLNIFNYLTTGNFDLLAVGVSIASINILGLIIYLNNRKSITNRTFFALAIMASIWGIINYISYQPNTDAVFVLWMLRFVLFFAIWFSYYFFKLMYVYPQETKEFSMSYKYGLVPLVIFSSFFSLTPYVFSKIEQLPKIGTVSQAEILPGIIVFGFTIFVLVFGCFYFLAKKTIHTQKKERTPYVLILTGTILTTGLLTIFNFIFPVIFSDVRFIPLAGVFILPFSCYTAYAIYKHGIFNVKIIASATLIFLLSVVILFEVLFTKNISLVYYKIVEFVSVLIIGSFLIQSMLKEIKQREDINKLAKRLTESNWELARTNERLRIIDQRKSEFVSIVSHQLRTPITAIKGYTSMILEESFGAVPETIKSPIEKIFFSSKRLAEMVDEFLDLSKIEQGRMTYNFISVDIKEMLKDIEEEFTPIAKKKDLALNFITENEGVFIVTADKGKVRQIFTNLIDNAIKYTPEGSVSIILGKNNEQGTVVVRIKDTGIGLSTDDIHHLFGKFARGEGGQKQYTEGSGLGLYVAKKILEAHHGKIWVDSPGVGKGAEFTVELLDEEDAQNL